MSEIIERKEEINSTPIVKNKIKHNLKNNAKNDIKKTQQRYILY